MNTSPEVSSAVSPLPSTSSLTDLPPEDTHGLSSFRCGHPRIPSNIRVQHSCRTCGRAHEEKWRKSPKGRKRKNQLAKEYQKRKKARVRESEARDGV